MNRKNRGLTLAALLGIFLFVLTCGSALAAYPVFYVKMENTTNYPIKMKWHFSTKAGENAGQDQITTIPAHSTMSFHGAAGSGRMHYKFHTGGQGSAIKELSVDGDTNPKALQAYCIIKYDANKGVGVFKRANTSRDDDF
jgi:hypothetical protein